MNKYNIKTTKAFEEELLDIYSHIVDYLQEPKIANEKYKKIRNKILSLQYLPERYSRIFKSKFKNRNLRKLLINNFVIIYEVRNDTYQIFILHIFNKYQNYLNKL